MEANFALKDDDRWHCFDVSAALLEERATWLREARALHSNVHRFFETTGTLVRFSRYDYTLASVAFFQSLPGLERALERCFCKDEGHLKELLAEAVNEGIMHDELFDSIPPFTDCFAKSVKCVIGKGAKTHSTKLAELLPELRNQYFHGTYLLAPDYLHLTFQVRQIADALAAKRA